MQIGSKRKDESIKTYLRIKPISTGDDNFVTEIGAKNVVVKGQQQYFFDRVFDANATNKDIFQQIGEPLINHSLEGYNACVLAYGQTSSGKTYTMKGNEMNLGIIPLTLQHLFKTINSKNLVAEIRISYIEIYNENIIDLLSSTQNYLEIREDPRKNITIQGLNEVRVVQVEEAMKLFEEGQSRRKFASNNLNANSSRSHTIFRVNVQIVYDNFEKAISCINMVDLAGSQGVSRTKAEGNTKKQGQNINKSILALSNVIRCMSEKQAYVNFRDSKLTRILQSSLCNNSRSMVICTVNPTQPNYQQTINTLKFGTYASQIKLELKRNVSNTSSKYLEQSAKSIKHEGLLPQERVEFQENKRAIATLRQQNQQLRDYKRILNEKIQFLQLENHRQLKNIENLQQRLANKRAHTSNYSEFTNQQKQEYERQNKSLKAEMQNMADQYEALNQYSAKLEKNQKYLIERISQYQNQITVLKETVENTKQQTLLKANKIKTPIKNNRISFKPHRDQQQLCPLTIGSIIVLKAQIIELKQAQYRHIEDIAKMSQEINDLKDRLERGDRGERMSNQGSKSQESTDQPADAQKKQIRNLHIKIKNLKNQVQNGKNRQKKLAKLLRSSSEVYLQQFQQFNEWYAQRKKRIDSLKKQKAGSAYKSAYKQNNPMQN